MAKPKPNADNVPEAVIADDGTVSEALVKPAALRLATFRDDQGDDVYHDEAPITGGVVYIRELTDEEYGQFLELQSAFKTLIQTATDAEKSARELEAQNPDGAAQIRGVSEREVEALKGRNLTFTRELVKAKVAGWSFERPYSPTAFRQLGAKAQNAVIEKIVGASVIGRQDSDFLAESSVRS